MRTLLLLLALLPLVAFAQREPAPTAKPKLPTKEERLARTFASPLTPTPPPPLMALSALVMDAQTGAILWANDPEGRFYPASTTKILTALLLVENTQPGDLITTPFEPLQNVQGSSAHLKPGETMTSDDFLAAMMLRSANDACAVVAIHLSGSVEAFAAKMNERAKALGATKSNFVNPHGLHDPNHFTTAHDLALIAREALKNPRFAAIARAQKHSLTSRNLNDRDVLLLNRNDLLKEDPSMLGVKTGFTDPAGRCFVGAYTRNGVTLITVLLNSIEWRVDQVALSEWAYKSFERREVLAKGALVKELPVTNGKVAQVGLITTLESEVVVPKNWQRGELTVKSEASLAAPVLADKPAGFVSYQLPDGSVVEVPLVTQSSIEVKPWFERVGTAGPVGLGVLLLLGGTTILMRRRAQRIAGEI